MNKSIEDQDAEHPELSGTGRKDPFADDHGMDVTARGIDVRGTVFIIPLDAPLPNELAELEVPTGSLYKRLSALDEETTEEFHFVPVSGGELLALERAWSSLCASRKVAVLAELPGARYDVLFTQARRQIGLRTVDWPVVAEALSNRVRLTQRTADKQPWDLQPGALDLTTKVPVRRRSAPSLAKQDSMLAPPTDSDGDADVN